MAEQPYKIQQPTVGYQIPIEYNAAGLPVASALPPSQQPVPLITPNYNALTDAQRGLAPALQQALAFQQGNTVLRPGAPNGAPVSSSAAGSGGNQPNVTDSSIPKVETNFDEAAYLKANPDVANPKKWKRSPFEHWKEYGQKEGRAFPYKNTQIDRTNWTMPENFDEAAYLKANPDVGDKAKWEGTPYEHWKQFGQKEGRPFPYVAGVTPDPSVNYTLPGGAPAVAAPQQTQAAPQAAAPQPPAAAAGNAAQATANIPPPSGIAQEYWNALTPEGKMNLLNMMYGMTQGQQGEQWSAPVMGPDGQPIQIPLEMTTAPLPPVVM